MRVVLDTSVLVSFLLTRGRVISAIIKQWETGRLEVIVSPQLIAELRRVAEDERLATRLRPGALEVLLRALTENAEVVAGELELPGVTEDPDDDMVVACAVEGNVAYIITRDQHLLRMGTYRDIVVVSPEEFVAAGWEL
ncbi:MAG: putative toxin-antitoxin system toxin component, PIN family [Anaerolineae bacterium]|nr:putative toxin-antitoxin system toxin component, PIN family [Anaerolineae bacterium]